MATGSGPDVSKPVVQTATPWWVWALSAALAAIAAYGYFGMVQTQEELKTVKSERLLALRQAEEAASSRDGLRQQLEEVKSAQAASESQRQKIEADVKAASTRMAELQKRVETVEGELNTARNDLTTRDSELGNTRRQLTDATSARESADKAAAALQEQLTALSKKLTETEAALLTARGEAEKLRAAAPPATPPPATP